MDLDYKFGKGTVIAIDTAWKDTRGEVIPMLFIKAFQDGQVLPIPWLPIGAEQNMPMRGQQVLYYIFGSYDTGIVRVYGNNAPHIRKGAFGLNEGEAILQSDSGKGYYKAASDGRLVLATGDSASTAEADSDGWVFESPNFTIDCFGVCKLAMNSDGSVSLTTGKPKAEPEVKVLIGKDRSVSVETTSDITMKAGGKIMLDGQTVLLGPGASDPTKAALFGDVESAGKGGTHPFDYMTGAPIAGSSAVKVAR